jgi:hypothetical protein
MESPIVTRTEYQLVNIDDGFLNLMDDDGNSKDDVKVPEDKLGKDIEEAFENGREMVCTVVSSMGEEFCLAWKDVYVALPCSHLPLSELVELTHFLLSPPIAPRASKPPPLEFLPSAYLSPPSFPSLPSTPLLRPVASSSHCLPPRPALWLSFLSCFTLPSSWRGLPRCWRLAWLEKESWVDVKSGRGTLPFALSLFSSSSY